MTQKYTNHDAVATVNAAFSRHALFRPDQAHRYGVIREKARTFALYLTDACPPSTELASAIIRLEEAVMWANASIARHDTPAPSPRHDFKAGDRVTFRGDGKDIVGEVTGLQELNGATYAEVTVPELDDFVVPVANLEHAAD